jgi:hypothetical protein
MSQGVSMKRRTKVWVGRPAKILLVFGQKQLIDDPLVELFENSRMAIDGLIHILVGAELNRSCIL